MAFPSHCSISASDYSGFLSDQTSRIQAVLARYLMATEPYSNLLEGGTFAAQNGTNLVTVVPDRMVSSKSLVAPTLLPFTSICGYQGTVGSWGEHRYNAQLGYDRGRSPDICVNDEFYVVKDSLRNAIQQMKDFTREYIMADNRWQMLNRSGTKITMQSGAGVPADLISGGTVGAVDVNFPGGLPDCPLTYAFVKYLDIHIRETLAPEYFGDGAGEHAVLITSGAQNERLRNEAGVRQDVLGMVIGNGATEKALLKNYAFVEYPYRGIQAGIDWRPIRFNTVDANGYPVPIEPYVATAADTGTVNAVNPAWALAQYEVSFLVYKNTFRRVVPERFVGEGEAKFEPQFVMGELNWHYQIDNACNLFGDFGFFKWQVVRGFQPIKPYLCIPILHKRCAQPMGLDACDDFPTTVQA
jgi:hypothetical protein